ALRNRGGPSQILRDKSVSDRLRKGLCLSALGAPRQRRQTSAITPGVPSLYRDGDQCLAPRQRRVLISLASQQTIPQHQERMSPVQTRSGREMLGELLG